MRRMFVNVCDIQTDIVQAPESLKDGVFSSCSDVFSYGIVLWEMATLASQPYQVRFGGWAVYASAQLLTHSIRFTQGLSNDQVLRYVIDGGVMERPENCPEKLYSLMCRCWQHRPTARPTFIQIVSMLLDDASTGFRSVSFYHSAEGRELLQLPQRKSSANINHSFIRTRLIAINCFSIRIENRSNSGNC